MARELLFTITRKDLVVTWYKSGGKGGQKKNKVANACRIQHPASGTLVTASENRSRAQNQKRAMERLVVHPRFRVWHAGVCHELMSGETTEQAVDRLMQPENIVTEVKHEGKWTVEDRV